MRVIFAFCCFLILGCSGQPKLKESIIYLKSKEGNLDLYQSDLVGQWERRLTTNSGWDWNGKWNEGRKQLIYYSKDDMGKLTVLAMNKQFKRKDTLPFSDLPYYQLAPDGQSVLYAISDSLTTSINKLSLLDQNKVQVLTSSRGYNGRFQVSSDGTQLSFISDRNGSNQLYLLNLQTNKLNQLTQGSFIAKYNSFSPDGKKIAVTLAEPSDDPLWDIYIIEIETGEMVQLTNTPYSEQEIAWSSSGMKIAFHGTSEADGDQIYTIDLADGKFTKITSGNFYHGEPAWLPFDY